MTQDEWRQTVNTRLSSIETRLADAENKNSADKVRWDNVDRRLGGIEDNTKWISRLVIGAILLAAIGFAMNGGFSLG